MEKYFISPKTIMDTQHDGLEKVDSFLNMALFGIYVRFLGIELDSDKNCLDRKTSKAVEKGKRTFGVLRSMYTLGFHHHQKNG